MSDEREIEAAIRGFLSENFPLVEGTSVDGSQSLVEAGVIDSTGVLELVDFIETRFDTRIPDEELVPENLDTIDNMVRYLSAKVA
jgi:acyl carrier protein